MSLTGNFGIAISFCGKDEDGYWKGIIKLTKAKVTNIDEHPYPWKSTSSTTSIKNSNTSDGAHKSRKSDQPKKE